MSEPEREILLLLASELVTNGVLHARTALQLGVTITADAVMIAVGDRNGLTPEQQPYSDERVTGRGLTLVSELATDWGVTRHEHGKTVWCTVRRAPVEGRAGA